ncbi:MAG TPA: nuclear transport factor 2 family protein [Bacteroidales bacterium]|nr:nuclear transport factor 2 family protein [Bacteroidales bacterium]
MSKKNGINIVFFVFIAILFLTISCVNSARPQVAGQLLKADRDFSTLSAREGMHRAFLAFIADSGVILRPGSWPLKGRNTMEGLYSKSSDSSFVLTWEPLSEKIAESGDLGYTFGIWKSRVKSSGEESEGTYVTIWGKQADGSWKFLLDTGNEGLSKSK